MITATRRFTFSAAHRYERPEWSAAENRAHYGRLTRVHGHNYVLEVTVRGPVDGRTGMILDLGELRRLVGEAVVDRFDHALLNDDAAFPPGVVPTTENLVGVIWELLVDKLGRDRLHRLRLWEDPTFHVDYRGEP